MYKVTAEWTVILTQLTAVQWKPGLDIMTHYDMITYTNRYCYYLEGPGYPFPPPVYSSPVKWLLLRVYL